MNFSKIINGIKEAVILTGYNRTAKELLKLSDRQLDDIGVSKKLLTRGGRAYPWRSEEAVISIPENVTKLRVTKEIENTPFMPRRSKAA